MRGRGDAQARTGSQAAEGGGWKPSWSSLALHRAPLRGRRPGGRPRCDGGCASLGFPFNFLFIYFLMVSLRPGGWMYRTPCHFFFLIFARPDLDARATVISAELRAQSWQVTKTTPTPSSAGLTWNRACDALISGNGAVAGCSGGSSPAVGSEACRRRCGGRGAGELCGWSRARRRPRPRGGPGPSGIFFLLLDTPKPRTRLEYKM